MEKKGKWLSIKRNLIQEFRSQPGKTQVLLLTLQKGSSEQGYNQSNTGLAMAMD